MYLLQNAVVLKSEYVICCPVSKKAMIFDFEMTVLSDRLSPSSLPILPDGLLSDWQAVSRMVRLNAATVEMIFPP